MTMTRFGPGLGNLVDTPYTTKPAEHSGWSLLATEERHQRPHLQFRKAGLFKTQDQTTS